MRLDLLPRSLRVTWRTGDLEDGVAIAAWGHDVRARLLLYALDGGAFGAHHQAHHTVRHAHLDRGLARQQGRWRTVKRHTKLISGCAQHGEVLSC